eukprot:GHUV01022820.1.p1 GENE.GHUV01022820.1~~GHUV01022820.1.p1  ORF type:complete len:106 (-),score=20.97 GHUV01022820.1:1547-1864(-)
MRQCRGTAHCRDITWCGQAVIASSCHAGWQPVNLHDSASIGTGLQCLSICREVGYNHYKGRMGWEMPNTAAMLAKHRPEKYVFHWGLGTLTHYRTAEVLHRPPPS